MGPLAEVYEILTVLQKNRLMDFLTFVSLKETLDQLATALHPTPLQPSLLYTELLQEGFETLPGSCEGCAGTTSSQHGSFWVCPWTLLPAAGFSLIYTPP